MSKQSLIPFGLRLSDQQLVDVSEVERGKKCGCICPSCKTALISRQGQVNEWCFAHVAKGGAKSVENECEFSFWVSVVLMAKQILTNGKSIKLPALTLYNDQHDEVPITATHTLSFDNVQIEQRICSIYFDALLTFKNYSIAILLSTPSHQPCLRELETFNSDTIGVLEISLVDASYWLLESSHYGKYAQILKDNILENGTNKRWLYHPRQSMIEKKYHIHLHTDQPAFTEASTIQSSTSKRMANKKISVPIHKRGRTIYKNIYITNDITENEHKECLPEDNYKCVKCKSVWYGTHVCKECNTHLYSIIKTPSDPL